MVNGEGFFVVNLIWLLLLVSGVAYAAMYGNIDAVTAAIFSAAGQGISITLEIAGVLALWMGLLKLADRSGLVRILAKLSAPLVARLFPDVPRNHPAFGAIVMNLAANFLGLGNAATPFGIKAMTEMQKLNPNKDIASAPMITFLVMNTSSFTLVPAMVISLRVQAGSAAPAEIIGATALASGCAMLFALLVDFLVRQYNRRRGK